MAEENVKIMTRKCKREKEYLLGFLL